MKNYSALLPAILALTACTKDLDLDYHEIEPIPVIEANLTDKGLNVRMTLTSPMNEPMDSIPLSDYTVTLSDPDVEVGRNYRLEIERGGRRYISECTMQAPAEIADVSFEWIRMPYDHVAVMRILLVDDPTVKGEAWWVRVRRNGKIYKWLLNDDKFAIDGTVEITAMTARRNPTDPDDEDNLNKGDILLISATRIPPHIYTYLSDLSAHTIGGPTTFTAPGSDFCLGYFLASTPATRTLIYDPDSF